MLRVCSRRRGEMELISKEERQHWGEIITLLLLSYVDNSFDMLKAVRMTDLYQILLKKTQILPF